MIHSKLDSKGNLMGWASRKYTTPKHIPDEKDLLIA
jgi:hypothetical protein